MVDVYRQYRTNILQDRSYLTESMGLMAIPSANTGEAMSQGVDFAMDFQKQLSQSWWTSMRANFTYATSEVLNYDEINYPEDQAYRSAEGHSIAQQLYCRTTVH